MAIKKSQLYSTLWESCNALRGSMDASQYKDYVLMVLFVKYLSDKARNGQGKLKVPEGCHYEDFVALKHNPHIGEEVNKKLEAIRAENTVFIGDLTLPNFNDDTKLGTRQTTEEPISKHIAEFQREELDFSQNRAADDDLLGDAYEYLMKNFAVESGKSKGQFYTPAEVSRVMAKVLHMEDFPYASHTIYDMTCGSGSLLLRALSETNGKPSIYGQEKDSTTASLAKLNMLLHGIIDAEIQVGDTLNDPLFKVSDSMLETFDVCVANPPFSLKNWLSDNGEHDKYGRWNPNLLPPAKCGDYAFLLHMLRSMKPETGRGACILPHGVLFRGGAEYTIRKKIVDDHHLRGIIGLPPNLFFGTGIPACILILDKKDAKARQGIFIIDAKDGFTKVGNMNRLREQDIKRIVDTWNAQEDVPHYARIVNWAEIEANDYNLNIPRYVQPRDTEIHHDIDAHLHGGLPLHDIDEMEDYWNVCTTLRDVLFKPRQDGRYDLAVAKDSVAATINQDKSLAEQQALFESTLKTWARTVVDEMKEIDKGCQPKQLINDWSESLLQTFKEDKSLADAYEVYDHLMNYWADTMQDDCYLISNDGWDISHYMVATDYTKFQCDLLPIDVLLRVYYQKETEEIAKAQQKVEDCQYDLDTFVEEQAEVFDEFDKVNESIVKKALKEADMETLVVLNQYLHLCKAKKEATKRLSELQKALTKKVVEKYYTLKQSPDDVRTLVVEKKWMYAILNACQRR